MLGHFVGFAVTLPVAVGVAVAVKEGDAKALDEGDALALEEGDALALDEGDALALEEGDALALEEGDAPALDEGDALASVVAVGVAPAVGVGVDVSSGVEVTVWVKVGVASLRLPVALTAVTDSASITNIINRSLSFFIVTSVKKILRLYYTLFYAIMSTYRILNFLSVCFDKSICYLLKYI